MEKKKKKGFWEKFAHRQLGQIDGQQDAEDLCILSDDEQAELRKIKRNTLFLAALAGTLGVVFLSTPHFFWEEQLFPVRNIWIPYYEAYIEVEVEYLLYGLVLLFFEIWFLTYINIRAVKKIAEACGFPGNIKTQKEEGIKDLVAVSLDKKQTELKNIGINPYEGLSKISVFLYQVLIKLKATFSGILFKIFVKRILGRYAIRYVLDFAGIPIYAFWNMYGAHQTMREARVRVLAPPIIEKFVEKLHEENKDNPEFKNAIYNTLQTVSKSKRSFHFNHYLLATRFLKTFEVPISPEPKLDEEFLTKIKSYDALTQKSIVKLLVLGIVLDGRLSFIEKRALKKLNENNVLPYNIDQIKTWTKDFYSGRGLNELIQA